LSDLDDKINEQFTGLVVRKDLVKTVKGNAIVPSYVLEYLLGQYCATADEASIQSGIETVKEVLRKHYVHRNEAGLIKSTIREKGRHKIIDKVSVSLNDKLDVYEAQFSNLGIKQVLIDSGTVKKHPKLLVSGVWCIADIEYDHCEEKDIIPWTLSSLKPIQVSQFDFEGYKEARRSFTMDEWLDVLVQSIGFNPEMLGRRNKLFQLIRLIPFCERNYNMIELGPKGTGKSHIYSEFSPHGTLISGGEITAAKLFVNNSSGKIGLVGYWDTVAFDEFAGKTKKANNALVDIMKNYMANKSFSRGVETLGAEASMVFVGNTSRSVPYMLKHSNLFDDLPVQYQDTAFLDRLHFYIPGWEVDIIRGEMFSDGYGFVVDYLAEILRSLRSHDYSHLFKERFELSSDISTRDRNAILKSFSGMMKILFPDESASKKDMQEILEFCMEGRKRVKDQLCKIDETFQATNFYYKDLETGRKYDIVTLEEDLHPGLYAQTQECSDAEIGSEYGYESEPAVPKDPASAAGIVHGKEILVKENSSGFSYKKMFGPCLQGANKIIIEDPFIRTFHQVRNINELIMVILETKPEGEEIDVHLVTAICENNPENQGNFLEQVMDNLNGSGINFSFEFDTGDLHDRCLKMDNGWKIKLGRGLDVFQRFDHNDVFNLANNLQEYRQTKSFGVTYLKH